MSEVLKVAGEESFVHVGEDSVVFLEDNTTTDGGSTAMHSKAISGWILGLSISEV